MVRAKDIKDPSSAEAWLRNQPVDGTALIGARAAARVLPVWADYFVKMGDPSNANLALLRALFAAFRHSVAGNALWDLGLVAEVLRITQVDEITDSETPYAIYATTDVMKGEIASTMSHAALSLAPSDFGTYFFGDTQMWEEMSQDAQLFERHGHFQPWPLWSGRPLFASRAAKIREEWSQPNSPYAFWLRWYESLLDPLNNPPINPDLLREIVLIDEEKWTGENAPEVIAAEIARLEQQFDLRAQVATLREEIRSLRAGVASPDLRRSNLPDGMTPLEVLVAPLVEADEGLREAEEELSKSWPTASRLRSAALAIAKAAKTISFYVAKKMDKALDTAVEEGTKQTVKWVARITSVGLADHLFGISKAIMAFIDAFLIP